MCLGGFLGAWHVLFLDLGGGFSVLKIHQVVYLWCVHFMYILILTKF